MSNPPPPGRAGTVCVAAMLGRALGGYRGDPPGSAFGGHGSPHSVGLHRSSGEAAVALL